jgi:hypothetical protein
VAAREQGAGPGPPGGPAAGGPDGRVEALLAEAALDDRDRLGAPAMAVGRGDQAGGPGEQPGLDRRGDQQGHRPDALGRGCGQPEDTFPPVGYPPGKGPHIGRGGFVRGLVRGLVRRLVSQLVHQADGQVDQGGLRPCGGRGAGGVGGAHADVLWGGPRRSGGRAAAGLTPGGERDSWVGPGGRLASAGGRSRAPGPGTRAGPLQPRGEAGVVALGGVPVRHGKAGGCRYRPPAVKPTGRKNPPLSDRNHPVLLRLPDQPG